MAKYSMTESEEKAYNKRALSLPITEEEKEWN